MIEQFKQDVDAGLSATQKFLPSQYFYDAVGDALFRKIMAMPEYYLTRAEYEIFNDKTQELIDCLNLNKNDYFEIIELGPGDGKKSKMLLKELLNQGYNFIYHPIDISENALQHLENSLNSEIPELTTIPKQGLYFDAMSSLKKSDHKKIVLFLGSNIGNLEDDLAADFLYKLGSNFQHDDILLLGVDLKKDASIVLPAYNDAEGITAQFNLNILNRINRELGGDFDMDGFEHQPEYLSKEGIANSYLTSLADQTVHIKSLNKSFSFSENEKIHTETSRKYDEAILNRIIKNTDFILDNKISDSNNYFADFILKRS